MQTDSAKKGVGSDEPGHRRWWRRAPSIALYRKAQLAQALAVGEHIDLDDFPAPDRKAHDHFAVAAWREAPYFSDAERAALALAEAATRLADRSDPVPDEIWEEAARHYDEKGLGAIVLMIATTNFFNRVNVTTRKPAGSGW